MSAHVLSIIPTDPFWVPGAEAAEAARAALARVYPGAREVGVYRHEDPVFVDQGENFESVRCPGCHSELPIEWWQERMDEAYNRRFRRDLTVRLLCCDRDSTLNDLIYIWPAGFARFGLFAVDYRRAGHGKPLVVDATSLDAIELEGIADVLGHQVKQILAHY